MTDWQILYRGSLSSCNYGCWYCPFAKTRNTAAELRRDAVQLNRFVDWVAQWNDGRHRLGILFTPWGEGLIHRYYQEALVRLSRLEHVYCVSIQTNLSGNFDSLGGAGPSLALWASYHPSQTTMEKFVAQCRQLKAMHIRYSVGCVGLHENHDDIARLREVLPESVYLWINAYKDNPGYYNDEVGQAALDFLRSIDPVIDYNLPRYHSQGKPCRAGHQSFSVDGEGNVYRCHFIDEVIGNIDEPHFGERLIPSPCGQENCGCYIGYMHRKDLPISDIYGDGLLARIPRFQAESASHDVAL